MRLKKEVNKLFKQCVKPTMRNEEEDMLLKRIVSAIICILLSISIYTGIPNKAYADDSFGNLVIDLNQPDTRAVNTTFDLDFSESENWRLDFDNDGSLLGLLGNHRAVRITFNSAKTPEGELVSSAVVTVYLQIKDANGTYQMCSPRASLVLNGGIEFALENSDEVHEYRLNISCSKDLIGNFTVKSLRAI